MGAQVYYVSADGKHLFLGDMVEVRTRANLTEGAREKISARLLNEIGEQDMIVLAPKETRHTITVFTDVDCPYCVRLHQDVPELNRQGVKVRYLLYPRAGIGSETYRRSVATWCAADRVKAVGIAKSGGRLDMKTCANPVERHYRLGERLRISGTLTIYLENGRKPGCVPPAQLLALIGGKNGTPRAEGAPALLTPRADAARLSTHLRSAHWKTNCKTWKRQIRENERISNGLRPAGGASDDWRALVAGKSITNLVQGLPQLFPRVERVKLPVSTRTRS